MSLSSTSLCARFHISTEKNRSSVGERKRTLSSGSETRGTLLHVLASMFANMNVKYNVCLYYNVKLFVFMSVCMSGESIVSCHRLCCFQIFHNFVAVIFSFFQISFSITHIIQQLYSRLQAEVNAAATGSADPNTTNEVSEIRVFVVWK